MAHFAKHTKAAMGHLCRHYERGKDEDGNYLKYGNESIDLNRTHLNYNLSEDKDQLAFIHKRVSEVYCLNRKDVNLMCSWAVTIPKDFKELNQSADEKDFFRHTYDFLVKKYGQENVISAYVHLDETTPHMHFAFVPVVFDKKKNRSKVSAKECVNKYHLQGFHDELEGYLKENGLQCSILNGATKEGNKSIEELKRQSAAERLQEVEQKSRKIVFNAQKQVQGIKDSLIPLNAEYEAKKAYVREADNVSDVSVMYPNEAKVIEKGLIKKQRFVTVPAEMWEAKHISANEKAYLQKAIQELEKSIQDFQNTASSKNIAGLMQRVKELENKNAKLNIENRNLIHELDSAEKKADKMLDKVNKTLSKLPDAVAEQFIKTWETPNKSNNWDWER